MARLNRGTIRQAGSKNVKLVDYFDALSATDLSDGTHPKRRGYARMEWALSRVVNPF